MVRWTLLVISLSLLSISCGNQKTLQSIQCDGPYAEDWESLAKYNEEPGWFKDAKFGIYFHWGGYSVPAY